MAITQRSVASGVGGVSLGVAGAEATRHAVERGVIGNAAGWLVTGGAGATGVAAVGADVAGLVSLPPEALGLVGGVGVGAPTWYGLRDAGIAPRIVLDIPDEVNLADPLITTAMLSLVGLAAATAASALM